MSPLTTESNPTRDAAARYAERGFRVIPLHKVGPDGKTCSCPKGGNCPSAGKHPIHNEWQAAERMTEADMDRRFGGAHPYNIGIATGRTSGIFVFDIDPKDGGWDSMRALAEDHGKDWAGGYRVRTGSGGLHLYFAYPEDFEIGQKAGTVFGKGIDIRGKGGQVVAPPSRNAAGAYELLRDVEIGPAPDWMLKALRPKERKQPEVAAPAPAVDMGAEARRLQGYVDGALEHELGRLDELTRMAARPGQPYLGPPWDTTTFEVAANLLELANADWNSLTPDTVEALILQHAPKPDNDGWTLERVHEKIDSAAKKVDGEAAVYPPQQVDPFAEFVSRSSDAPTPTPTPAAADDDFADFVAEAAPPTAIEVPAHLGGVPVVAGRLAPGHEQAIAAEVLGGAYHRRVTPPVELGADVGLEAVMEHPALEGDLDVRRFDHWVQQNIRTGTPEAFWAALGYVLRGIPDPDAPPLVLRGCDALLLALSRTYTTLVDPEGDAILLGPPIYTTSRENALIIEFDPLAEEPPIDLAAIVAKALASEGQLEVVDGETIADATYVDRRAAGLERRRRGITPTKRGAHDGTF